MTDGLEDVTHRKDETQQEDGGVGLPQDGIVARLCGQSLKAEVRVQRLGSGA